MQQYCLHTVIVAQQDWSLEAGCWSDVANGETMKLRETVFSPEPMAGSAEIEVLAALRGRSADRR